MPKRRKTHKNVAKVNDPDASILADGMNDESLKKETFLRDFDVQVANRIAEMESEMKRMMTDMNKLFTSNKLSVKKEIRKLSKKDFLAKGGDWCLLDFTPIASTLNNSSNNISFQEEKQPDADEDITFKAPLSTVKKNPVRTVGRKRNYAESPLLQDAPLSTRSRGRPRLGTQPNHSLYTPRVNTAASRSMITPKFDLRKPLTVAREPKHGETLVSLSGSPVIQRMEQSSDESSLVSLVLNKEQTLLGGSLFDLAMSPNTLVASKERLQEAMNAINQRMDDLDEQCSGQSKLLISQ